MKQKWKGKWNGIDLNWIELNWIESNRIESNRIESNRSSRQYCLHMPFDNVCRLHLPSTKLCVFFFRLSGWDEYTKQGGTMGRNRGQSFVRYLVKVYTGYGENGPAQGKLWNQGMTEEMKREFPDLDYITGCSVVESKFFWNPKPWIDTWLFIQYSSTILSHRSDSRSVPNSSFSKQLSSMFAAKFENESLTFTDSTQNTGSTVSAIIMFCES